jgi:hypothetical protein
MACLITRLPTHAHPACVRKLVRAVLARARPLAARAEVAPEEVALAARAAAPGEVLLLLLLRAAGAGAGLPGRGAREGMARQQHREVWERWRQGSAQPRTGRGTGGGG